MRALRLGAFYFAGVFVVAFILGALRTAFVEPILGPLWPVLIELPIVILGAVLVAHTLLASAEPPLSGRERLRMSLTALALLLWAELMVALFVRGWSLPQYGAHLATPEGLLGLFGFAVFAALPMVLFRARR